MAGIAALMLLAAIACALRLYITRSMVGDVSLHWPAANVAGFRWTALANGAIVGASLGLSGMLLQALLRNPLAEPFILGISSGAGLGVMIALYIVTVHASAAQQVSSQSSVFTLPAMMGAIGVLGLVYLLGQRRGVLDPVSLVLVGVIISTVCGAGIMFVQHLVPTGLRGEFTSWLMGYIPEVTLSRSSALLWSGVTFLGLVLAVILGGAMDVATLGDDEARSVGLAIGRVRSGLFVLAGLLAAIAVAIAGPIGFVGLIAPHAARLVLGPRHASLAIGSAMLGVAIVVGADVARQAIDVGGGRMPIGIFTALLGGPAFIWLLLSGRGQA
jgi:iron complex transport system permease protein